jgi:hypothetical protein
LRSILTNEEKELKKEEVKYRDTENTKSIGEKKTGELIIALQLY